MTDEIKRLVGELAVDSFVKPGMKLGLGTGTTAVHAVRRVAQAIQQGTLSDLLVVPTSMQTLQLCQELGLAVRSMNDPDIAASLDLAIDGADAVDPDFCLIKGGGGAHLIEKIVAYSAKKFVVIVDESKLTDSLGPGFPIPLEVIPEARFAVQLAVEKMGGQVVLREAQRKIGPVISENGNMILDVRFPAGLPAPAAEMEGRFNAIPGVVENGLFTRPVEAVVVGMQDGRLEVRTRS